MTLVVVALALAAALGINRASIGHAYITSYSVHPDGRISVFYEGAGQCPKTLWERAHVSGSGVVIDVAYRKPWPWEVTSYVAVGCGALIAPDAPFVEGVVMMPDGTVVTAIRPF